MTELIAATEFHTVVERYEHGGWVIRTIDHGALRAAVREGASRNGASENGPASAQAGLSVCRKLWVDAQGQVQETDVPC